MVISSKNGMSCLTSFPNNIRIGILETYEIPGKSENFMESYTGAQPSSHNTNFVITSKTLLEN